MIIITLTKNSSLTIDETIQSLETQKFENFEWYIFDSNSTDDTLNKINNSSLNFKIINLKTEGIFQTYNEILNYLRKLNSNKIIFFLHSDDLIYDEFTLGDVYSLFQNKKLDAIYGNIVFF